MIRPLEYCTTLSHLESSINTIDQRILDLTLLREKYVNKTYTQPHQQRTTPAMSANRNKILVIDNYDSFTYNLVHLLQELGQDYTVWRNDKFELQDVMPFDKILLSPGPGIPEEAGLLMDVIRQYAPSKSILGICLGQQAIAEVFGGTLYNMPKPLHGVATDIIVTDEKEKLFLDFPRDSKIGRYHSWAVTKENIPTCLQVTAVDADGVVMALRHEEYDVRSVQFHPESVLTTNGKKLIANWLNV